jgi:anaerobic selenocysteine-containing dehydrogenase
MKEIITACPRNCYSTCSFVVQVENNRIKRILPYDRNLATPEGPCIKGLSYIERAGSTKRIIHPLIRTADGRFKQASMKEALRIIAEKLGSVRDTYGSHSILWYKGSGNSGLLNETGYNFWRAFGGVTSTYGNLCWPAGLEAVRLTLGEVKHNVPWDLVNAGAIIIWGKNPAETNIQEMAFIGKARERGAKIIVIDPRRTATADKCDIHFKPVPGTDAALALACAWVLVHENLTDKEFVAKFVKGYDEFAGKSLIPPETAENICGIPAEDIVSLARIIGTVKPVTFLPGYGLQRYTNGGQTIRSLLSLAILSGNIGKSGAGFNYANLQSYIYDNPKEPLSYYPDAEKDKPFRRSISMITLGNDILNTRDPEIKAIWVERGNPLLQVPDSGAVREAFGKSLFTVVVEQFLTDTAEMADIILPAKDIFEQSDIIGSYWSPYVQFKPKALEPEGEVMPESEIYYHLAELMDIKVSNDEIPPPGNENAEKWLSARIAPWSELTLDDLRKGPVIAPGLQEIAFNDMVFKTRSGKIELSCQAMSEKWNASALPAYVPLINPQNNSRYPLVLICPNTGSRIHSQFGNLDVVKKNSEPPALEISQEDAEDRHLVNGDRVIVYNNRGKISTVIKITGRLDPGMVILHNGIWLSEGGGGNTLTESLHTDIGYGAAFHGNRVEVEKELLQ